MHNLQAQTSEIQFDKAFPILHTLPLKFQEKCVPMVWIDPLQDTTLQFLYNRVSIIGKQAGFLSKEDRIEAYGQVSMLWIFAPNLHPDTFFLHISFSAAAFTHPRLLLPPFKADYLVRCDLRQSLTKVFFDSLDENLNCFLQFTSVPKWVRGLTAPVLLDTADELNVRIAQLLLCSQPIIFDVEDFTKVKRQVSSWQTNRDTRKRASRNISSEEK